MAGGWGREARASTYGCLCVVETRCDAMQFEEDVVSGYKHRFAHQRIHSDIAHRIESKATRHRPRRRHGCWQAGDIGRGSCRKQAILYGFQALGCIGEHV
jgi:hypothetical protein